jgi:hypothetical protein
VKHPIHSIGRLGLSLAWSSALVLSMAGAAAAESPFDSLLDIFGGDVDATGVLDAETAADGLREALRVGTERATASTSTVDGFLGNELIRIALPEQMTTMTAALRAAGMGDQVDELDVAMNRAAEQAAGEARAVFWEQISSMTVNDALDIVNGSDTAATDYFRERTSDSLRARFQPIVAEKIQTVGLYQTYKPLADSFNAMPFVTTPAVDLESYVTEGALDGLFTVLGEEEQKIREDPVARSTDLLRRVFGEE